MLSQAQLDGLKLKSKFTFIDVEEGSESSSLRRCKSTPLMTHSQSAQCEDGYLAGLLAEARALTETTDIAFPPTPVPQSIGEACDQDSLPGSLGHPHFCRRPCVLLALGQCRSGTACKYCHLVHDNGKPQSFSKHIRERIHSMKGSAKLRLLRDSLQHKVQKVPTLASQVAGLSDIIEEGLRHDAPESTESTGSQLHKKVAGMTVSAMLGDMFTRDIEPAIQHRLQEELRRLRIEA
ncbi:unnamed protein product [Symbiodinium necroappetens]|uniref:C3H1-type domain-containing protein n=1 Tax=Symbiodinium necroappetens TaxID=1628268 RepID=A0A812LDM3_9DINO|nr:unnamed protein product [Symbiodinium necroappetens]